MSRIVSPWARFRHQEDRARVQVWDSSAGSGKEIRPERTCLADFPLVDFPLTDFPLTNFPLTNFKDVRILGDLVLRPLLHLARNGKHLLRARI